MALQNNAWRTADPSEGKALRDAFGSAPTGVAVVTTLSPEGRPVGLTINSFASVSMTPPLLLWSLATKSPSLLAFQNCPHFALSILAEDQEDICSRFATPAVSDKFSSVSWHKGPNGMPLIDGAVAHFECRNEKVVTGGDHIVFFGQIENYRFCSASPLIFHRGNFIQLPLVDAA